MHWKWELVGVTSAFQHLPIEKVAEKKNASTHTVTESTLMFVIFLSHIASFWMAYEVT